MPSARRVGTYRRLIVVLFVFLAACTEDAPPTVLVETTVPRPVERTIGWDGETLRLAVLADLSGVGAALERGACLRQPLAAVPAWLGTACKLRTSRGKSRAPTRNF